MRIAGWPGPVAALVLLTYAHPSTYYYEARWSEAGRRLVQSLRAWRAGARMLVAAPPVGG